MLLLLYATGGGARYGHATGIYYILVLSPSRGPPYTATARGRVDDGGGGGGGGGGGYDDDDDDDVS
jgi:hypothetical protein